MLVSNNQIRNLCFNIGCIKVSSQFAKRQKKKESQEEVASKLEPIQAETVDTEPVYTQTGLDIYTSDGGKSYGVAEIVYNPETGEAKVLATFSISRLVALSYANQKTALNTLKRKANKT